MKNVALNNLIFFVSLINIGSKAGAMKSSPLFSKSNVISFISFLLNTNPQ